MKLILTGFVFAALIESDAEGIGGRGFVECIREHIHSVCSFHILIISEFFAPSLFCY